MMGTKWLFGMSVVARLSLGSEASPEESASLVRARLLATRLETEVSVELRNGQAWKGNLTDITENNFLLLAEPDKETRKRLKLGSGMRIKKNLAFDDVVTLKGGTAAELVERYLVLGLDPEPAIPPRLAAAAAGGFRVRAAAGASLVVLEKVDAGEPVEYAVSIVNEDREKELDEWGAKGFRVVPGTLGSWLGTSSAVLERTSGDAGPRDYRVLAAGREGTLEKEVLEAASEGYHVLGLTTAHQRVVLLEGAAEPDPPDYRILWDVESGLSQQARDGYRVVACSDGERACVTQRKSDLIDEDAYLFLSTAALSTLEKELNEAGGRGYRLLPGTFGVEGEGIAIGEIFAILEKHRSAANFDYRAFSADRPSKIQEEVGRAAQEGYRVVATTSGQKDLPGTGLTLVPIATRFDVLVVMERATPPAPGHR